MFVHHIAYRHENGELQGFMGAGLTPSAAHQHCITHARAAVSGLGASFAIARVIGDLAVLTPDQRASVSASVPTRSYLAALL